MPDHLKSFVRVSRARLECEDETVRAVHVSELIEGSDPDTLAAYVADRLPVFYRTPEDIYKDLSDGYFLSVLKTTLARLPTSQSFRESHFGEVLAGIFADEVLGLKMIYSKLSLTSAENENPKKMDLVLCRLESDPVEIILGEVKFSPKDSAPAKHDESCYPDLFRSLKNYKDSDAQYDLSAAKDRLAAFPEEDRKRIREALKPYSNSPVLYAGFVVIDLTTKDDAEMALLAKRSSTKTFEVDVLCVERLSASAAATFAKLEGIRCSL